MNERPLTHKFAEYLQERFPGWNVDCEYNRDGHDPKRVDLPVENTRTDDTEAKTVYPDIIVHRRGTDQNLLVVEAKKNGGNGEYDMRKLQAYASPGGLAYLFGARLEFTTTFEVAISFEIVVESTD